MAVDRVGTRAEETAVLEAGQPPCFAAGTLVHTREGLKPIEEISVDDWVLSFPDDQTPPDKFREEGEYFYKKVTQVFVTEDKPLCRLIVDNLASGDREEYLVTPEHPIYCQGRGWVPVSKIDACDCVEQFQFANLMVSRCYQNVARGRVYNFEVEDFHTYYVGKEGVWVHNTCGPEISKFELSKLDNLRQTDRQPEDQAQTHGLERRRHADSVRPHAVLSASTTKFGGGLMQSHWRVAKLGATSAPLPEYALYRKMGMLCRTTLAEWLQPLIRLL